MRNLIALSLAAFACSSALALSAYLTDRQHGQEIALRVTSAPLPVPAASLSGAETDNSRECSAEDGILSDCIFI